MAELPEGWSRHELNGSTFYYHRQTNTVQPQPPSLPSSSSSPAPSAPPPPTPPLESTPKADKHPPQGEGDQASSHVTEEEHRTPSVPLPTLQPPAMQAQPVGLAVPANGEQALAAVSREPCADPGPPMVQATLLFVTPPSMRNLEVVVPSPGLRAGQQMTVTLGEGAQQQRMSVTAAVPILAGSKVALQYPEVPPLAAFEADASPSLPVPCVQATLAEDQTATMRGWWLYAIGWACLCLCAPGSLLCWLGAAASYYCQPRAVRARRNQQRKPACVALFTFLPVLLIFSVAAVARVGHQGSTVRHYHHHSHHHEYFAGLRSSFNDMPEWNRGPPMAPITDVEVPAPPLPMPMPSLVPLPAHAPPLPFKREASILVTDSLATDSLTDEAAKAFALRR